MSNPRLLKKIVLKKINYVVSLGFKKQGYTEKEEKIK